jgi:hypothetical protein
LTAACLLAAVAQNASRVSEAILQHTLSEFQLPRRVTNRPHLRCQAYGHRWGLPPTARRLRGQSISARKKGTTCQDRRRDPPLPGTMRIGFQMGESGQRICDHEKGLGGGDSRRIVHRLPSREYQPGSHSGYPDFRGTDGMQNAASLMRRYRSRWANIRTVAPESAGCE